jgi:HSP20 family protein
VVKTRQSNHHSKKFLQMIYQNACVAKHSHHYGHRTHPYSISAHRAAVNVFRTENNFTMLVFAPGRVKENFTVTMRGNELTVSYQPSPGQPAPDWIRKEYSRGAFERVFTIDETVDATQISAKYIDGVLEITLPIVPGKEATGKDIPIN